MRDMDTCRRPATVRLSSVRQAGWARHYGTTFSIGSGTPRGPPLPRSPFSTRPSQTENWARISATVTEATGWDALSPDGPDNLGRACYQAAWDGLR
eukprot:4338759-Alexandrium_andersonii.AAC.1